MSVTSLKKIKDKLFVSISWLWTFLYNHRFGILLILLIWLQHRYWLFSHIYENFGSRIGGNGAAYYNVALIMQRSINILQGQPFSLDGDHFQWFAYNLGVAPHHIASGFVFTILYPIFQNPVTIFNIIVFGNLALLQVGMYILAKRYTKNSWISILVAILVPLSQAYTTVFGNHMHASLYWALPFLILFLEELFEKKSLSKTKFSLLLLGVFGSSLWLVFADWHVTIFSLAWLFPWGVYKIFSIIPNLSFFKRRIIGFISVCFAVVFCSLPLISGSLSASDTYNQVRRLSDIVNTNFQANYFFGSKFVMETGIRVSSPYLKKMERFKDTDFGEKIANIKRGSSSYPDTISNLSFWLGCFIFLPWLLVLIWKKGNFYRREFFLLCVFLLGSFIALGPFVKVFGIVFQQIPLPHYFLYKVFFPLSAIRAVWRAMIVGYLAILLLWAILFSKLWDKFKETDVYKSINTKVENFWKDKARLFVKVFLVGFGLISIVGVLLVQNNGYQGRGYEVFSEDKFLTRQWEREPVDGEVLDFFIWSYGAGMNVDRGWRNRYYNYLLSEHNQKAGQFEAVWVAGGSYGANTKEIEDLVAYVLAQSNTRIAVEVMAAKKVDLIIEEKDFVQSEEYGSELESELSRFYKVIDENDEYRAWRWQGESSNYFTEEDVLGFSLETSNYQKQGGEWFMLVNMANETNEIYANAYKAQPIKYTLEYWQAGEKKDSEDFRLGSVPFLFPGYGRSLEVVDKPNVKSGETELKLFREGQLISVKTVQVLDSESYERKLEEARRREVKLDQSRKHEFDKSRFLKDVGPYRGSVYTTNIKTILALESGVVENSPQKMPYYTNNKIISLFWNDAGEPYKDFPGWLRQPQCQLNGNYFSEDVLTVWCKSHLPFDDTYNLATLQLNEDR